MGNNMGGAWLVESFQGTLGLNLEGGTGPL